MATARVSPAAAVLLALLLVLLGSTLPYAAAARRLQQPVVQVVTPTAAAPAPNAAACSTKESPVLSGLQGTKYAAELNGTNGVKPNTTGTLQPLDTPAKGTFTLVVDTSGRQAAWTLELCDVPLYVASHLHSGSTIADYVPPLIPLEPYVKPPNPFAPPELLPLLCSPLIIKGCAYSKQGSFTADDIIPLAGRAPDGDKEVPTVKNWSDFLKALDSGDIYVNIHTVDQPAGLIRGNLLKAASPPATTRYVVVTAPPPPPSPSPEPSPKPSPKPSAKPSPSPKVVTITVPPSPKPSPAASPKASPKASPSPEAVTFTVPGIVGLP